MNQDQARAAVDGAREAIDGALAALRDAESNLNAARLRVEGAVAAAANAGIPQVEIVRTTGWSREHVRRLTRTSQHRDRVYIGGPLDGQPVEQYGDHWEHYRDDSGNSLDTTEGDLEWNGQHRRYYYWTPNAPGGLTYVHLTCVDRAGNVRSS